MAARVRHLLASQAPADWPDFPELARSFGMSTATLRRRLHAEGQSFAALKDARRATLARQFLQEASLSVADIATELGYSEPSAFYRAFRKWTGGSPAASRP
jgi:AraC-like DNA-binding protein